MTDQRGERILVIAGLGIWVDGVPKIGKIETHLFPLARAAEEVIYVTTGPAAPGNNDIRYVLVTPRRSRTVTLLVQLLVALRIALFEDIDLVSSFSLPPYGIFALIVGRISRTPTHLGIIGADIDIHATAWYGGIPRWLFRRFTLITVAGFTVKTRVAACGVPLDRVFVVMHPVSEEFYTAEPATRRYDLLWLTRMSSEKDPLRFVAIVDAVRESHPDLTVAMVGDGPLLETVTNTISDRGLEDTIELVGWTDRPIQYYRTSRLYVMTSEREILPLSLVEAMLLGVVPIVPPVGAIPELVTNGKNGRVILDRDIPSYAAAIDELLSDEAKRKRLADNAREIRTDISQPRVAETWEEILATLESGKIR